MPANRGKSSEISLKMYARHSRDGNPMYDGYCSVRAILTGVIVSSAKQMGRGMAVRSDVSAGMVKKRMRAHCCSH